MSFQDNKFPIVLGGVTALVVGGLVFWGLSSSKKYSAAKDDYDAAVGQITSLTGKGIFPNQENRQAKEKAVADYRASVEELQATFDSFRAPNRPNVEASAFTDALLAARKDLVAKFEAAGTELPADFFMGFQKYTSEPVKQGNTGVLSYQLDAFSKLFGLLAEAAPAKVNSVYRPELEEEKGQAFDAAGRPFRQHPIEISFTGREASIRQFLGALDDSKEFFFVTRVIRLKNERVTAPNAKDARFEAPKAAAGESAASGGSDPFAAGGFVFPTEETDEEPATDGEAAAEPEPAPAEPEEPSDSGEILKQVLGSENVQVFIRIDLLQFLEPMTLPQG